MKVEILHEKTVRKFAREEFKKLSYQLIKEIYILRSRIIKLEEELKTRVAEEQEADKLIEQEAETPPPPQIAKPEEPTKSLSAGQANKKDNEAEPNPSTNSGQRNNKKTIKPGETIKL